MILEIILAKHTANHVVMHWARRLGGPGLLLIGIVDASVIPTFGSLDALLVVFAARSPQDWPYFALMALIGSTIGGYLTYRMGRAGGKAALERRFSQERLEKVYRWTEKHAFLSISIPAFLPPPAPLSPFLLTAGAMNVSRKTFFVSYVGARAGRYALVGWLGSRYGHSALHWLAPYQTPILITFISLAVIGTPIAIWYWRKKGKKTPQEQQQQEPKAA